MTDEILKEDGVVLQYMGDGILACWNVPRPEADHVDRACRAALAMRKRLAEIEPAMRCGIGLHTGRVVAGTIGSEQIFAYGLIGPVINQASRVEGITKTVGAPILVTREIAQKLTAESGASATLLGLFRPAGMTADLELYELRAGPLDPSRAAAFREASEALRAARWSDVAPALSALPADDGPARYLSAYAEKCASVPPPAWRGVIELSEK
jgi:adenylate cyclase